MFLLLSSVSTYAQADKPLRGLNIMLDPGHGGADSGAVGPTNLKESDTNLRVARYLRMLLEHDGANVSMTREKPDTTLSLSKRVSLSKAAMPDLFVSIHHNASLSPRKENQSEIYYDAKDHGISRLVADNMNQMLAEKQYAGASKLIPAGFYVLRNNTAPSILTEGSYISIPESERELRSGKGLTKEAEILWKSIRKAYKNGPLKLNLYIGKDEKITTYSPYFNCIFTSNKVINSINARVNGAATTNIGIRTLTAYPITYTLYNTEPLKSGNYELIFSAVSSDGTPSPRKTVQLNVELPIAKAEMLGIAPYIPENFKGRFPLIVKLYDSEGNLNTRKAAITIKYSNGRTIDVKTSESGISTCYIDLDGTEKGNLELELFADGNNYSKLSLPIVAPAKRFVLGKLIGLNNQPLINAQIKHNGETLTNTTSDGIFYFSYPLENNEFNIEIQPGYGYKSIETTLDTDGEPVILPQIKLEAIAPALLNKKIAVMAAPALNETARNIIKPLIQSGAKVTRLRLPSEMSHPEYQAVLEANLIKDLNIIISLKCEKVKEIQVRHYHSSKNGKALANAIVNTFKENYPNISIKSCAGSDYELGHTGATTVVLAIPVNPDNETREALADQLSKALKNSN